MKTHITKSGEKIELSAYDVQCLKRANKIYKRILNEIDVLGNFILGDLAAQAADASDNLLAELKIKL